jgi:hypothetical protein
MTKTLNGQKPHHLTADMDEAIARIEQIQDVGLPGNAPIS